MIRDPLIGAMGHKLTQSALQQRVLAHNLANTETPNFKAFRVVFEDQRSGMSGGASRRLDPVRTHPAHLGGLDALAAATGARLVRDSRSAMRTDGNNVDPDRELADLSANQLYYAAVSTIIRERFQGYRSIISGRTG